MWRPLSWKGPAKTEGLSLGREKNGRLPGGKPGSAPNPRGFPLLSRLSGGECRRAAFAAARQILSRLPGGENISLRHDQRSCFSAAYPAVNARCRTRYLRRNLSATDLAVNSDRPPFRQDTLQSPSVHIQLPCRFGGIPVTHLEDPLDVFPTHGIWTHECLWNRGESPTL